MTFFREKMSIFRPKISEDLFSSHRPSFSDFFHIFAACNIVFYDRSSRENPLFQKIIPSRVTSFYSVRALQRIRPTLLLKIFGGTDAWASPTSNFGGTVPPVPLGLRPCLGATRAPQHFKFCEVLPLKIN